MNKVFDMAAIRIPFCATYDEIELSRASFEREIVIASTSEIPDMNESKYIPLSPFSIVNNFEKKRIPT